MGGGAWGVCGVWVDLLLSKVFFFFSNMLGCRGPWGAGAMRGAMGRGVFRRCREEQEESILQPPSFKVLLSEEKHILGCSQEP